ncbi:hypothetical protein T35B1_18223 [Salinisphaera shabanensis T35B1]
MWNDLFQVLRTMANVVQCLGEISDFLHTDFRLILFTLADDTYRRMSAAENMCTRRRRNTAQKINATFVTGRGKMNVVSADELRGYATQCLILPIG